MRLIDLLKRSAGATAKIATCPAAKEALQQITGAKNVKDAVRQSTVGKKKGGGKK